MDLSKCEQNLSHKLQYLLHLFSDACSLRYCVCMVVDLPASKCALFRLSLNEWHCILAYQALLPALLWKGHWTKKKKNKKKITQTFIYWLSADTIQFIQSQAIKALKKHCYEQVLT